MKHLGKFLIGSLVLLPVIVSAQEASLDGTLVKLALFEDQSKMFEMLSLWSTLIIAFVTSAMVWIGGRRMHGGVFGSVLTYFSLGMTLVFFGFATEVPWFHSMIDELYLKLIHDSLYIIGYILMGVAANKLLRVIKGE